MGTKLKKVGHLLLLLLVLGSVACSSGGSEAEVSRVWVGESCVELGSAVAVVGSQNSKPCVQVLFFSEELSEDEVVAVAYDSGTIPTRVVNGKPMIVCITFFFQKGSTTCDFGSLANYCINLRDSEACPVPVTGGYANYCVSESPGSVWEAGRYGVTEMAGGLNAGERMRSRVKSEYAYGYGLSPGVDSLQLKWDLNIDCRLMSQETVLSQDSIWCRDTNVSELWAGGSSVPLYSPVAVVENGAGGSGPRVTVSFFSENLTDDEKAAVVGGANGAVNGKSPVVSLFFTFKQGAAAFDVAAVEGWGVELNNSTAFVLPWGHDMYLGRPAGDLQVGAQEMAGGLEAGKTIRAHVRYVDICDGIPVRWDLKVDCPLRSAG